MSEFPWEIAICENFFTSDTLGFLLEILVCQNSIGIFLYIWIPIRNFNVSNIPQFQCQKYLRICDVKIQIHQNFQYSNASEFPKFHYCIRNFHTQEISIHQKFIFQYSFQYDGNCNTWEIPVHHMSSIPTHPKFSYARIKIKIHYNLQYIRFLILIHWKFHYVKNSNRSKFQYIRNSNILEVQYNGNQMQ